MNIFVFASWMTCLATSGIILSLFAFKRWLFVKPSALVATAFHVCIQWAATIDSPSIEAYLPSPWQFFAAAQLFPLVVIFLSPVFFSGSARRVWWRITERPCRSVRGRGLAMAILAGLVVAVVGVFLHAVPLSQSGLYTVIFDPQDSVVARERSLKALDSSVLRYAFSFMISALGPLLAATIASSSTPKGRANRKFRMVWAIPAIGVVLLAVSLSGARSFAAGVILTLAFVWLLPRKIPIRPFRVAAFVVFGLSIPVMLSIAREGNDFSIANFWSYLVGPIFERIVHMPMETGLYYTHYAQTVGFLGAHANEHLASLLNIEYFNAAHELGLIYYPQWASDALNMNTCYVFAYYAYFGIWSVPLSVTALLLLDICCVVLARISDRLLLPTCATLLVACLSLISVEYTTALLTNGILVILAVAFCLDTFCRPNHTLFKHKHAHMPTDLGSSIA
jgi:hypothetical protein